MYQGVLVSFLSPQKEGGREGGKKEGRKKENPLTLPTHHVPPLLRHFFLSLRTQLDFSLRTLVNLYTQKEMGKHCCPDGKNQNLVPKDLGLSLGSPRSRL